MLVLLLFGYIQVTHPVLADKGKGQPQTNDASHEWTCLGIERSNHEVARNTGHNSNDTAQRSHLSKHTAQAQSIGIQSLVVVLGNHPGFKDTVEKRCADTSTSSTGEQDKQIVGKHREARERIGNAVQQTSISSAVPVGQLANERCTDRAGDKSTCIQSSDSSLRKMLMIFVKCIDVRALRFVSCGPSLNWNWPYLKPIGSANQSVCWEEGSFEPLDGDFSECALDTVFGLRDRGLLVGKMLSV